jgi:hypothetical protein
MAPSFKIRINSFEELRAPHRDALFMLRHDFPVFPWLVF